MSAPDDFNNSRNKSKLMYCTVGEINADHDNKKCPQKCLLLILFNIEHMSKMFSQCSQVNNVLHCTVRCM